MRFPVRVPAADLRSWPVRHPEIRHARIGLDPLLTANGKPYVIMRYADGPRASPRLKAPPQAPTAEAGGHHR